MRSEDDPPQRALPTNNRTARSCGWTDECKPGWTDGRLTARPGPSPAQSAAAPWRAKPAQRRRERGKPRAARATNPQCRLDGHRRRFFFAVHHRRGREQPWVASSSSPPTTTTLPLLAYLYAAPTRQDPALPIVLRMQTVNIFSASARVPATVLETVAGSLGCGTWLRVSA